MACLISFAEKKRRRFAAALLSRLFGKTSQVTPQRRHRGTGRDRPGDQLYPVLCHCQLGQDIPRDFGGQKHEFPGADGLIFASDLVMVFTGKKPIMSAWGIFVHRYSIRTSQGRVSFVLKELVRGFKAYHKSWQIYYQELYCRIQNTVECVSQCPWGNGHWASISEGLDPQILLKHIRRSGINLTTVIHKHIFMMHISVCGIDFVGIYWTIKIL